MLLPLRFLEKGENAILSFVRGGAFKKAAHPLAFLSFPFDLSLPSLLSSRIPPR